MPVTKCPIPLIEDLIPAGRSNRPGEAIVPQWITIHDTGNANPGADAEAHASYLKGDDAAEAPVSWHFTVDDKRAVQHLPLDEHGWHAADGHGPGNTSSIGVEICENADGDRAAAETNAAALTAWLLVEFGLDITCVVPHKHWYPKDCPHILFPRWNDWIAKVQVSYETPAWDPAAEIARMKELGLINSDHKPGAPVTWGEFATVLNRLAEG